MLNEFSLKGEIALITGGGNGLGFGIAECFVDAGARVVLVGRRTDVLQRAVKKLGKAATFEPHDIRAVDEAENLVKWVSQSVGPISILVNNAGIHLKKTAVETTPAEFNEMLQTHVVAAFSLTRAVLPRCLSESTGIFCSRLRWRRCLAFRW
jgi:gluconate 5-dehydrogenase